jgi:hypothetical protein
MSTADSASAETSRLSWTPGNALRRASQILRAEGPRVLWFRLLGEIVYRRMIFFERSLDETIASGRSELPVTISRLQPHEADDYAIFYPYVTAAEVRSRLERGHQCWVARLEGAVVHAIWTATGTARIRYLDCQILLAPDEAYIYESYTVPALRRLNLNTTRSEVMTRYFREHSFSRLLALVMPENPGGVHATLRAGYRRVGIIGRVKVGPWRRDFCRMEPDSRPVELRPGEPSH